MYAVRYAFWRLVNRYSHPILPKQRMLSSTQHNNVGLTFVLLIRRPTAWSIKRCILSVFDLIWPFSWPHFFSRPFSSPVRLSATKVMFLSLDQLSLTWLLCTALSPSVSSTQRVDVGHGEKILAPGSPSLR